MTTDRVELLSWCQDMQQSTLALIRSVVNEIALWCPALMVAGVKLLIVCLIE